MILEIDSLDALEVSAVEHDIVGVLGEDGRQLLCQRVHIVVGLGREQVEEDLGHALEHVVGRGDGDRVVEGGRLGIVDDALDESIVLPNTFHDGGLVVLELYAVEGSRIVGRLIVFVEKRIYSHVDGCVADLRL